MDQSEAHSTGVSWGAVVAGAFVTAALSLALLALGAGIGFSSVSPWPNAGASAVRLGRTAIAWLIIMQLIASSAGGYLAGRLRTRWVHIHTHEVYFRDTAHGFLAWAVALVLTAGFLTAAMPGDEAAAGVASMRSESAVIFANGVREGGLKPMDRAYLARRVAMDSNVSQADAERRVDEGFADAQQTADNARKALAHSMYWTFLALLVGAFGASVAATIGGKERDRVVVV